MVTTPHQQRAQPPGDAGTDPLLFDHQTARVADKVAPFLGDYLSEYDRIKSPLAAQKLSFWDAFNLDAFAATNTRNANGYTVTGSGGTNTIAIQGDATTGHNNALTAPSTTLAHVISLVWGEAGADRPSVRAAENPWFKTLLRQQTAPVGGTQDDYSGFIGTNAAGLVTGLQDGIYFRRTGTGNWFLVCRSTTETTLDMGVAATSTMILLEFRGRNDGGQVDGYYNGQFVGSIRATIPTALFLIAPIHHDNRAGVVTTAGQMRCFGWGFKRDAVA